MGPLAHGQDLKEEEAKFMAKLAPMLYAKLSKRQTAHVVFVGDEFLLNCGRAEHSLPERFLRRCAASFFYVGGVFEVNDPARWACQDPYLTYEVHARPEAVCFQSWQFLSTVAFVNSPDLVVLALGGRDAEDAVPLPTYAKVLEGAASMVHSAKTDFAVVGPPLLLSNSLSAGHLAWVRQWTGQKGIPWCDASAALLPTSVPFGEAEAAEAVWQRIKDTSSHSSLAKADAGAQGRLADSLLRSLLQPEAVGRYSMEASATSEEITLSLRHSQKETLAGFVFAPEGQSQPFSLAADSKASLSLPVRGMNLAGSALATFLIVDQRYLQAASFSPTPSGWSAHWETPNQARVERQFTAALRVHAGPQASNRLAYSWHWQGQKKEGVLERKGQSSMEIRADFPVAKGTAPLEIELGDPPRRYRQMIEAVRHIAPKERRSMFCSDPSLAENPPDPALRPGVNLEVEVTAEDLLLHYDFERLTLAKGRSAAVELLLAVDARPPASWATLGYVGQLKILAGPEEGPAKVAPTDLAQFGDGYDRVPKPSAVQALLGSRPDGTKRLTVRLTRRFFYLHPWDLNGAGSLLGLGSTLRLQVKEKAEPLIFRLTENGIHPLNPESLAVLTLSKRATDRWAVKAW